MSAFMHDVARASLPVAIALLILAATARAALWAQIDDATVQRIARQYLEPLATWCLVAVVTHVLALGAAGDVTLWSLVLPLIAGAAAVVLRSEGETERPVAVAPQPQPQPAPPAAAAPATGPLWAEPADEPTRQGGLWSR
jgi:TctA family transporter